MTLTIEIWVLYTIVSFLLGLLVGIFIGKRANPSVLRLKKLEIELEKNRDLLADYHERVNRHFSRTSDLFDAFTRDYKLVYQHLADGCADLCDDRAPRLSLEVPAQRIAPVNTVAAPPIADNPSGNTVPS